MVRAKKYRHSAETHPSFPLLIESSHTFRSQWKTKQWLGKGVFQQLALYSSVSVCRGISSLNSKWSLCIKNPQGSFSLSYHRSMQDLEQLTQSSRRATDGGTVCHPAAICGKIKSSPSQWHVGGLFSWQCQTKLGYHMGISDLNGNFSTAFNTCWNSLIKQADKILLFGQCDELRDMGYKPCV